MIGFIPCFVLLHCLLVFAASPPPRRLPPASDFRLTLREDPHSKLPLGESCMGEAQQTVTCRAFVLTLENRSAKTIRLSGLTCQGPSLTIERKEPNSSDGWWPVSQPNYPPCPKLTWTNLRLRPGERTEYSTRLVSPGRQAEVFSPGSYTLRARWNLVGCTEPSDGSDCLTPLQQAPKTPSTAYAIDFQKAVTVVSNELTVEAPALKNLGTMKFTFTVDIAQRPRGDSTSNVVPANCSTKVNQSLDCTLFHYVIQNVSDKPVRSTIFSCSDSGITPEYRVGTDAWKPVPEKGWFCTANIMIERPILPGKSIEGEFTLPGLAPGFNAAQLPAAREYRLRFTFWPHACIASPDASFCLEPQEPDQPVLSNEVTVRPEFDSAK
jgi:hypothetical protein